MGGCALTLTLAGLCGLREGAARVHFLGVVTRRISLIPRIAAPSRQETSSFSSALAVTRSAVSKPSVNRP
jgi:hypothetical protein